MQATFRELFRIVKPGGFVAFEVGEIRKASLPLEHQVVPIGVQAGFSPLLVMLHTQEFTKSANCWGVDNNLKGTNTQRIAVFEKP